MDQIVSVTPTTDETQEIETTVRQYLAEMQDINRQLARDQREIDLLKAETRVSLKNIQEIMDRLRVS